MSKVVKARRNFLKKAGATFCFSVAGVSMQLTPADAREKGASLTVLNESQASALEVLADGIVPESKTQGIAHFIDAQLAASPAESLLMLKYLGVPAPHAGFYTTSLDSAVQAAEWQYKKPIDQLTIEQRESLIDAISKGEIDDWQGPPANFFYFVLRSDAIDVVYGTERGFSDLDIPYMAHIKPTSAW